MNSTQFIFGLRLSQHTHLCKRIRDIEAANFMGDVQVNVMSRGQVRNSYKIAIEVFLKLNDVNFMFHDGPTHASKKFVCVGFVHK